MRFQGGMIDGLGVEIVFKYEIRFCKPLFRISKFFFYGKRGVILYAFMNYRGPFLDGLQRVEYCGQLFIVHFNEFNGFFRYFRINGAQGRNFISDIPYPILGQGVLISRLGHDPIKTVRDILTRYHTFYAGQFFGFGSIDIENLTMGEGASEYLAMEHSGKSQIICKLCSPFCLCCRIMHGQSLAHNVQVFFHLYALPGLLVHTHHRLNDLLITGTSAEIAGHLLFYGVLCGMFLFIQYGLGSENHPGRAEPALDSAFFYKCRLQGMKMTVLFYPLYGHDLFTNGIHGKH